MANELPWFRFTVQAWQNGKISVEDYCLKGLFVDICGYYWIQDCLIDYNILLKKFRGYENHINELISLGIIKKSKTNQISIKFLDEQFELLSNSHKSKKESGAKGGIKNSKWTDDARKKGQQLYVLLMYNQNEQFIKVGQTKNCISNRYSIDTGYKIEILFQDFGSPKIHTEIEQRLSSLLGFDFVPKIKFAGQLECFSVENIEKIEVLINSLLGVKTNIKDNYIRNSKAVLSNFEIYKDKDNNKDKDKDKISIEDRKQKFATSLIPFVEKYGKEMIRAFHDWWTQPNKSNTKMGFELQKTWDLEARLRTWESREKEKKLAPKKENPNHLKPTLENTKEVSNYFSLHTVKRFT